MNLRRPTINIDPRASGYAAALANETDRLFFLDQIRCRSIESVLQAFRVPSAEQQKEICAKNGVNARKYGQALPENIATLFWGNKTFDRHGNTYQRLLDHLYLTIARQNPRFQQAIFMTGEAIITYSSLSDDPNITPLTAHEACTRLTALRELIKHNSVNTAQYLIAR